MVEKKTSDEEKLKQEASYYLGRAFGYTCQKPSSSIQ